MTILGTGMVRVASAQAVKDKHSNITTSFKLNFLLLGYQQNLKAIYDDALCANIG